MSLQKNLSHTTFELATVATATGATGTLDLRYAFMSALLLGALATVVALMSAFCQLLVQVVRLLAAACRLLLLAALAGAVVIAVVLLAFADLVAT